ncbi:MAG: DUF4345 family protein [Halieaceae bacterium]|jgi:hypothetical protein|nr:DUF4345 family protein [Halieaceae bacterium]
MTRAFLLIVGLIFAGYGLACAIDPGLAARLAGLEIVNGDGYAELGAMYGGLQTGVGLFLVLAALRPSLQPAALLLLVFGIGLLAVLRGASALRSSEIVTAYTWGALAFETLVTALAAALHTRRR